ncbi:hypothetical protein A2U01_0033791, partial [Trifolium medium]|nr:hypothetical protein [Trifolium medium]
RDDGHNVRLSGGCGPEERRRGGGAVEGKVWTFGENVKN